MIITCNSPSTHIINALVISSHKNSRTCFDFLHLNDNFQINITDQLHNTHTFIISLCISKSVDTPSAVRGRDRGGGIECDVLLSAVHGLYAFMSILNLISNKVLISLCIFQ